MPSRPAKRKDGRETRLTCRTSFQRPNVLSSDTILAMAMGKPAVAKLKIGP